MLKEIRGTIIKLFDKNNGIIVDDNGNEYYFSKVDFLHDFKYEIGKKVIFKPKQYQIKNCVISKATYIGENNL